MENKTARDPKYAENVERNRQYLNSIRFAALKGKGGFEVMDINGNPGKAMLGQKLASAGVDWKAIGKAALR